MKLSSLFKTQNVLDPPTTVGTYRVIKNTYWNCLDKYGRAAIIYQGEDKLSNSSQTNKDEKLCRGDGRTRNMYGTDYHTVFIDVAYLKIADN